MMLTLRSSDGNLGQPVPPFTPHAISVSLPKWQDNIDYEVGTERIAKSMVNGYPRFFIMLNIQKLAGICEKKFAVTGERCMLFPSARSAEHCREFMARRTPNNVSPRITQFVICQEDNSDDNTQSTTSGCIELQVVLFPADVFPVAKEFWQHTGLGISSRLAARCLSQLSEENAISPASSSPSAIHSKFRMKIPNRHYSAKKSSTPTSPTTAHAPAVSSITRGTENLTEDCTEYLEERYGRNLPQNYAENAKRTLRRRIAGVLVHDNETDDSEVGPSTRVPNLTESDVFLFQTGMTAIWHAHHLALKYPSSREKGKSVCFGFPYTDTLKVLQKWGPGCHFFGYGTDSDIDALEELLAKQRNPGYTEPPILALFTEFPSNPLLRSANLPRLRKLADEYDFLIVIDETVGNFVNVSILPYADIVVSSLSKVFSGDSNVMGGSLVLNPNGRHYAALKESFSTLYEDTYFNEDAIFMERNSRFFKRRIQIINENAEGICDFLHSRRHGGDDIQQGGASHKRVVKEVYYPKYTSRTHYDKCRVASLAHAPSDLHPSHAQGKISPTPHETGVAGGYGGLFSVTFTSQRASEAFFDALRCHKGPSLGTSFTLACPFVILAHFTELEWAASYGVEAGLVRVSVGGEDRPELLAVFEDALRAAEEADGSI